MELHPLAPLLCSAAILRHQRFPAPGWGVIYSHYFTMWHRKLNYHVIISRVEVLHCSIQQLDKTMQIEIIALDLLRSHREKSEVKKCGNTRPHFAYTEQGHLPAPNDGIYGHLGLLQRSCTRNGHCALANAPIQGHLDRTKWEKRFTRVANSH